MRRSTVVGLVCAVGIPSLIGAAGTTLLRLQASRLRRDFTESAKDSDAPGLRTVLQPSTSAGHLAHDPASSTDTPATVLAVLGDSWLAGSSPDDPARLLARGLATLLGIPVRLSAFAEPSARAESLITQVDRALADPHLRDRGGPRIAVISMGTADIIFPVTGSITLGVLSASLTRLERAGFAVIVLTCPNLSSLPGIRNPLRMVLRRSSRVLAGSQWLAALAAGALPISLTQTLSGTTQSGLVDPSGQRPSPLGRRQLASAILRSIAERFELPRLSEPSPPPPPED